jgi:DNA-binding transcriptional LysR family regulator
MPPSPITLDLYALRTFVTGIELNGFGRAASRVGRSSSAVSAQLKKLSDQVGQPLLRKSGRTMVTTPAGEHLLGYARRMLELNDEAILALTEDAIAGTVRVGVQEDFGENFLSDVLSRFALAHPKITVEAQVARNAALLSQVRNGRLDLALAWDSDVLSPHHETLGTLPLCWIGRAGDQSVRKAGGFSLAAFEAPCAMRTIATETLDRANLSWRLAFTGSSLAAIWAAVRAGLGVTVRTTAGMPSDLHVLRGLPKLPKIAAILHRSAARPSAPVQALANIIRENLGIVLNRRGATAA